MQLCRSFFYIDGGPFEIKKVLAQRLLALLGSFSNKWSQANIVAAARYLGVWLGPAAGEYQWKDALQKLGERALPVRHLDCQQNTTEGLWNLWCVVVLSHISKFSELPDRYHSTLATAMFRVSHMTGSCLQMHYEWDSKRLLDNSIGLVGLDGLDGFAPAETNVPEISQDPKPAPAYPAQRAIGAMLA